MVNVAVLRRAPSQLTYRDAVRILGADDALWVKALDRLLETAATVADAHVGGGLTFFGIKDDLVAWGRKALSGLSGRLTGLSRLDRTEQIHAACKVLYVTAYLEAVDAVGGNFDGYDGLDGIEAFDVRSILTTGLPVPSAIRPLEDVAASFEVYLPPKAAAQLASQSYLESFRQLAGEVPEFALWAGMTDAQATRTTVARGFDHLATLVRNIGGAARSEAAWAELGHRYRAQMNRQILNPEDAPAGIMLPTHRDAFVPPRVRIWRSPYARITDERNWANQPEVTDVQQFLAAHLMTYEAFETPTVLLGQPGSGKSTLTRVLAAALLDSAYLPLRVELRDMAARDLRTQLAQAVFNTIDRHVDWRDLTTAANGALPVIMLDGFDELIQASGANDADYLLRIRDFQLAQLDLGQPVAVIVTSRTSVADRATLPHGTTVLRLEPFNEVQVRDWLARWNTANSAVFAQRGLRPLAPEAVLAQAELTGEPLLLLMLALFDADTNALRRADSSFSRAELYERLLLDFAQREVRKLRPDLTGPIARAAAEGELRLLAVTALSMFSRGLQSITEQELDADLRVLLPNDTSAAPGNAAGPRTPMTTAQALVGRFFFIHQPRARNAHGEMDHSFEFLHATFGEFLVARLIVGELMTLAQERLSAARRPTARQLDTDFLRAILSCQVLSARESIVRFSEELLSGYPKKQRDACRSQLVTLLCTALSTEAHSPFDEYRPVGDLAPRRYAVWSANLVILAVYSTGEALDIAEFFDEMVGGTSDYTNVHFAWRDLVQKLWSGQIASSQIPVNLLRIRYAKPAAPEPLTVVIERELGQPVFLAESMPRNTPESRLFRRVVGAAAETMEHASAMGRLLCRVAWGAAESDNLGSLPTLFELALAPADAIPADRRTAMYLGIIEYGSELEWQAATQLFASDEAFKRIDDPQGAEVEFMAGRHTIMMAQWDQDTTAGDKLMG